MSSELDTRIDDLKSKFMGFVKELGHVANVEQFTPLMESWCSELLSLRTAVHTEADSELLSGQSDVVESCENRVRDFLLLINELNGELLHVHDELHGIRVQLQLQFSETRRRTEDLQRRLRVLRLGRRRTQESTVLFPV